MKRWLVGAAALAAGAGVLIWGYCPRERSAIPRGGDLPGRILASEAFDSALWLPYPHQNLAVLEGALAGQQGWLEAAARLTGAPEAELPSFGPFRVPPARELAAGFDSEGDLEIVAARIYPGMALLARLAGRLAANPWLAGGPVEVSGRTATVSWEGGLWVLAASGEPVLELGEGDAQAVLPKKPLLAALRSREARGPLPDGLAVLRRRSGGLALVSLDPAGEAWEPPPALAGLSGILTRSQAAAAILSAGEQSLTSSSGVFLLFDQGGSVGRLSGMRLELPSAAVLSRGGLLREQPEESDPPEPKSFRLPGENLPRFLIGRPRRGEAAGWSIKALDAQALDAATAFAPELTPAYEAARRELAQGGAGFAILRVDPSRTLDLVDRGARLLEELPLASREEARRWRDWHTVLAPLTGFESVSLIEVEATSPGLRLVLER